MFAGFSHFACSLLLPVVYSVNSWINAGTVVISLIFHALAPQKIRALSTSPLAARISAMVMQYGVVAGLHVFRQLKQWSGGIRPFSALFTKALRIARPVICTGLFTRVMSSFLALTYICLNASDASHSFVATNRVAICTPESPRER